MDEIRNICKRLNDPTDIESANESCTKFHQHVENICLYEKHWNIYSLIQHLCVDVEKTRKSEIRKNALIYALKKILDDSKTDKTYTVSEFVNLYEKLARATSSISSAKLLTEQVCSISTHDVNMLKTRLSSIDTSERIIDVLDIIEEIDVENHKTDLFTISPLANEPLQVFGWWGLVVMLGYIIVDNKYNLFPVTDEVKSTYRKLLDASHCLVTRYVKKLLHILKFDDESICLT